MKNKKKNFAILSILIIFILLGISIINSNSIKQYLKSIIPTEIKNKISRLIFYEKNLLNSELKYNELKKKYDNTISYLKDSKQNIKDEIKLKSSLEKIQFSYNYEKKFSIFDKEVNSRFFKNDNQLLVGIFQIFPGSAYLDFYDNKMFIISSTGLIGYTEEFKDTDNIKFTQIYNNIDKFINEKQFTKKTYFSIKDILIKNDKVFVSYTKEKKQDCWITSILYAPINLKDLNFVELFDGGDQCALNDNEEFNGLSSGGKMQFIDEENIVLTQGEYGLRSLAQDINSLFGKTIKININNRKYEILSMGHRNPQGLLYDKEEQILLSSEHGPQGGDEINLIPTRLVKTSNFGWPVSSYGEHYGGREGRNKHKYKEFPLYKSHKKYGFKEPIKFFVPSIATSEIIGLGNKQYVLGSLKAKVLYVFKLDDKNSVIKQNRVTIGERIRDLSFYKNQIYLFLEDTATICVIDLS